MEKKFEFKAVMSNDFPLLMKWHQEPHVLENWNSFASYEAMCDSYEKKLSSDFVFGFLIYFEGKPIGYIHAYKAWKVGEGWWPEETEGCWGIDQFIGDLSSVGKGLGPMFMTQFIQDYLVKQKCKKVIVDPAPGNARAIRAYEKAGFASEGVVRTPDGDAVLMVKYL